MKIGFKKRILLTIISLIILAEFIIPKWSYAETASDIESIPEYDPGSSVSQDDLTNIMQSILDSTEEEENTEEEGGALFTPISQFILGIADGVMSTLQSTFIGDEKFSNIITSDAIKEETPGNKGGKGATIYRIKYSPAAIFSGQIPAFDINFFSPLGDEEGKTKFYKTKIEYITVSDSITYEQCKTDYGATNPLQSIRDNMSLTELFAHGIALVSVMNAVEALANTDWEYATYGGGVGMVVEVEGIASIPMPADAGAISVAIFLAAAAGAEGVAIADRLKDKNLYYMQWQYNNETYFYICDSEEWMDKNSRDTLSGTLYKIGETTTDEVYEKTSTAYTLRPIIASWYIALRNLALVGLLSVLLYVGIRILMSSTSQDKAKYKKMLLDWLIAIAILFVLHYLMVFILSITERLTNLFTVSTISIDGTDKFITNIRNMATGNNNDSYFTYFGYVIMYIALAILTVIFTIQYIKRLVFIAFLTMVSPLIALTYPIDKIKDGQAQAFSIWIREYIFNCLLQPVHLLLYTIFIESASKLVNVNPVYAIIVLAFFIPAEKFIRKMFGFEKASTVGTVGAAAGGAMLMNMMNKIQGKAKHANLEEKQSNDNRVRTVNEDEQKKNEIESNNENVTSGTGNIVLTNSQNKSKNTSNSNENYSSMKGNKVSRTNRRKILGPSTLKSTGRWIAKTGKWATNHAAKIAGAFGGATIGLGAGVASGELGNTAKYTGAGAIAGANIASGINRKIQSQAKHAYGTHRRSLLGRRDSNSTNNENNEHEINIDEIKQNMTENIRGFSDDILTNPDKLNMAMENGITGQEYKAYKESGVEGISDIIQLKENEITEDEFKEYESLGIKTVKEMINLKKEKILPEDVKYFKDRDETDLEKIIEVKKKHPEYSHEGLADMFKLAKNVPKTLPEFKKIMVNKVFYGKKITEKDAEAIFKELNDFF